VREVPSGTGSRSRSAGRKSRQRLVPALRPSIGGRAAWRNPRRRG
jgi:hypothetical protein